MAKGLRASTRKKNNAALRARLFGPAIDARTARLSAKLQELAAKPRPDQDRHMEVDSQGTGEKTGSEIKTDEMDVDALGVNINLAKKSSQKQMPGRTQKKIVKRKAKNSVVFPDIKAKWRRQATQKRKT